MEISKKIQQGSHLKVSRGLYSHHGIYVGNDNVVHYSGLANGLNKGKIKLVSLKEFMGQATELKYVKYDTTIQTYDKDDICERALSRLNENKYNILFNNCEHFACWCVTGKQESKQVQAVMQLTTTVLISASTTIFAPNVVHAAGSLVGLAGSSAITKVATIGTTTSAAVGAKGIIAGASTRTITDLGVAGAKALIAGSSTKVVATSGVVGVSNLMMAAPVSGTAIAATTSSTIGAAGLIGGSAVGGVTAAGFVAATAGGATATTAAIGTMGFVGGTMGAVAVAPIIAPIAAGAAVGAGVVALWSWLKD